MLNFRQNQKPMKYALQQNISIPEFEIEYYEDDEGKKYPVGVKPTGKMEMLYTQTEDFFATIAGAGGEAEAVAYGMSIADYAAKMTFVKGSAPLKNGALVWVDSEPTYKHIEVEVDGEEINGDFPERTSADFYVVKVPDALDNQIVFLQAINK